PEAGPEDPQTKEGSGGGRADRGGDRAPRPGRGLRLRDPLRAQDGATGSSGRGQGAVRRLGRSAARRAGETEGWPPRGRRSPGEDRGQGPRAGRGAEEAGYRLGPGQGADGQGGGGGREGVRR